MCIVPNYVHLTQPIKILPQDLMHQSIPPTPSPPPLPRADPRELAFFCLGWQILGGGDSWAVKSPGVGTKKESKCPVLRQHCNIRELIRLRRFGETATSTGLDVMICAILRMLLLTTRADKGWAVKRARPSKKVWCSGLGLCLEMSLVFDFGQGLRCG